MNDIEVRIFDTLVSHPQHRTYKPGRDWWGGIKVQESHLPQPIIRFLREDHGPNITLGEISDLTDAELVRSANIGSKSRNVIREYISGLDNVCN